MYELQLLLKSPVAELCVIIIGKEYIRKRRDTIFRKADFKPIVKTNPPPPAVPRPVSVKIPKCSTQILLIERKESFISNK